eukprot:756370-Hanusia_phi.AAC.12
MRARPVIAVLFLFLHHAWSITPEVLEVWKCPPEQVVTASIPPSGVKCYFLSLNDTIAREIVYWSQVVAVAASAAQSCCDWNTGQDVSAPRTLQRDAAHARFCVWLSFEWVPSALRVPKRKASSLLPASHLLLGLSRNDMLAAGQTPPAEWEWVGDIESLDIELS